MSPVSALPAIAIALLALGLAYFFDRFVTFKGAAPPKHLAPLQAATHASITSRNASIDGMRGLLALFVFLHHACIWYFSLSTGQWKIPPSYFYTHLGQSSVALFFMITAFLFSNKLLDASCKTGGDSLNSTEFWIRRRLPNSIVCSDMSTAITKTRLPSPSCGKLSNRLHGPRITSRFRPLFLVRLSNNSVNLIAATQPV